VRKTSQIDGSKVKLIDPKWQDALDDDLLDVETKKMDCGSEVEAHLSTLLIYEKGGFFKTHRDTEKELGMFGTLVSKPSTCIVKLGWVSSIK